MFPLTPNTGLGAVCDGSKGKFSALKSSRFVANVANRLPMTVRQTVTCLIGRFKGMELGHANWASKELPPELATGFEPPIVQRRKKLLRLI
jgi:hypothetical protein